MPFTSTPRIAIASSMLANLHVGPLEDRQFRWDPTACNPFEQEAISNALAVMHVYRDNIANRGG